MGYFIGAALNIENCRARVLDVVEHYLRALEEFGVERMEVSDEELRVEYEKAFLAGVG